MSIKKLVLQELESIKFPTCNTRSNIMDNKPSTSFVLGDVNYRGQKYLDGKVKGPSRWNLKYQNLYELIQLLIQYYHPDFQYTTIQVNKNVECQPHIDKNNVGKSYIIGLGDYNGGELAIEGRAYNIKNRWKLFDGHKAHWTLPFTNNRYTLVFFTHTFKPPCRSLTNLTITKNGIYKQGICIKEY